MPARPRLLHRLFAGGIALKGLMGLCEAVAGTALLLTAPDHVRRFVAAAEHWHVIADRHGPLARRAATAAAEWPAASQHFYALYLLLHGGLKMVMVALLWMGLSWAYPAAIAIQGFFVLFEGSRWFESGNPVLLGLALLDAAIIVLIAREWQQTRAASRPAQQHSDG